jgi:hypothetical protein
MPRPTNKNDLIEAASSGYEKLLGLIDELPANLLTAEFGFEDRDRNIRDVLAHLVAWQHMMSRWYGEGMAGQKPAIPAPGYTFAQTPALNHEIWESAQSQSLEDVRPEFQKTHQDMMALIAAHTDEELFTKKHYKWTGTTSLGAYLISATSSHYDWALKKLRQAKKSW